MSSSTSTELAAIHDQAARATGRLVKLIATQRGARWELVEAANDLEDAVRRLRQLMEKF